TSRSNSTSALTDAVTSPITEGSPTRGRCTHGSTTVTHPAFPDGTTPSDAPLSGCSPLSPSTGPENPPDGHNRLRRPPHDPPLRLNRNLMPTDAPQPADDSNDPGTATMAELSAAAFTAATGAEPPEEAVSVLTFIEAHQRAEAEWRQSIEERLHVEARAEAL